MVQKGRDIKERLQVTAQRREGGLDRIGSSKGAGVGVEVVKDLHRKII